MPREINDQAVANRTACKAAASAARGDRNAGISCGYDRRFRLQCTAREGNRRGFDLINRRIRRVELTGQIIESDLAIGRWQCAR